MTLKKSVDTVNWNRRHYNALFEELALEEAMNFSQERQQDEMKRVFDTVPIERNTRKTVLQRWILQYLSTFIQKNRNQQSRVFLGKSP
jgi:hypothetical protein